MSPEAVRELLRSRRSVREFSDEPVSREVLEGLLETAVTAPSASNRQPWRFTVVTSKTVRASLAAAVRARAEALREVIARSHHAEDFGAYGDFFHEPLERAPAVVVPSYREHPDLLASLVASGGGDPERHPTVASMQPGLCSTAAAVATLLLAAHSEGLGACWMAGPMIAREELSALLGIAPPWRMLGAVALGWPREAPGDKPARRPLDRVVTFIEDGEK